MSRARWVVLTPSQTEPEWRRRVTDAATAAGLKPVPWAAELGPKVLNDPRTVVLAQEMGQVRHSGAAPDVVVLTDPESSVRRLGETVLPQFPQALWTASQIHAEACDVPDAVPVIGGASLAPGEAVTLWSGLAVAAPALPARPKEGGAAAEVMSLYRHGRPPVGARVRVAPKLFLYDTRNPVAGPQFEVDLTGRPRTLVFGPYFALPAGVWQATATFASDTDAAGRAFRIDWGTQTSCVSTDIRLAQAGTYEARMEFVFEHAAHAELRVVLTEGALGGSLRFLGAEIERTTGEVDGA